MKLLKATINGVKNFEDEKFDFDFTPELRVQSDEIGTNIFELTNHVQINNVFVISGVNASGKSTTLKLLNLIINLIGSYKSLNNLNEDQALLMNTLLNDYVDINTFWYNESQKMLYRINSRLRRNQNEYVLSSKNLAKFDFTNEEIYELPINKVKSKKMIFDTSFYEKIIDRFELNEILENSTSSSSQSKSIISFELDTDQSFTKELSLFKRFNAPIFQEGYFNKNIAPIFMDHSNFEENVELLKLFDPSLEYLVKSKLSENNPKEIFKIKFDGQEEIILRNSFDVNDFLSIGTIHGVSILCNVRTVLNNGTILLLDEIENHLNKTIIKLIIGLFTNNSTNPKNAQLVFSTHYPELLDIIDRRDSLYIVNKIDSKVNLLRVSNLRLRPELKNSALFFGGHFGTGIEHQRLTKISNLFKRDGKMRNKNI